MIDKRGTLVPNVSLQIPLLGTDGAKPDGNTLESFEVERLMIHLQINVKYKNSRW